MIASMALPDWSPVLSPTGSPPAPDPGHDGSPGTSRLDRENAALREQVQRVDAAVHDVVDRARLQVIRADELFTRTLDRVEQTTDMVHKTVISPVRQFSGIMQGITAGLEFLFGGRGRRNGGSREDRRPIPQDEMFI